MRFTFSFALLAACGGASSSSAFLHQPQTRLLSSTFGTLPRSSSSSSSRLTLASTTNPPTTTDIATTINKSNLENVNDILSQLYGHERVRRLNAAMSKSNYLQANPHVNKRQMTYGELPLELFQETLQRISSALMKSNRRSGGSFVDLGSGVGRLTIAAALLLAAPQQNDNDDVLFTESKGIEIVDDLHISAMEAYDRAYSYSLLPSNALPISFHHGDAFDPTNGLLSDASAVFCYSTTWECDADFVIPGLSNSLANAMQVGSIVAMTDRKLANPFVLVDTFVHTNHEKGGPDGTSTINIYRLE